MNVRGFEWTKQYKKESGAKRIQDVLALSPDHDPFNVGSPAHRERADWFAALWKEHYQGRTGIHLRRIHYFLVSIQASKPHHMPYENKALDWVYLQLAALYARILHPNQVPADAFDDRRNADPYPLNWRMADVRSPRIVDPYFDWDLPSIRLNVSSLAWTLERPRVDGYSPDDYLDRAYLIELWIEKSTMDDILVPLAQELGIRLVPSSGFQSISNAVKLLQRIREIGKPTRVFYISDYDKSGRHMPISVARHVEFWRERFAPGSDVKLIVLALTEAQIAHYHLPTSMDSKGSVELDALEALAPGELDKIVRRAVEPYLNESIDVRLASAKAEAREIVEGEWHDLMAPHKLTLAALKKRIERVTKKYQKKANDLNKRLARDMKQFRKPLAQLQASVADHANSFCPKLPERPAQTAGEQDEADCLFDSSRSYDEQLRFYKARGLD